MRTASPNRDGPEKRALDAWLRREFAARYDSTLTEPLPTELLELLSLSR